MKQDKLFTVGLVTIAAILGSYMYFVESKKDVPADTKDVEIWSISEAQANELKTLSFEMGGQKVAFTRDGETWRPTDKPNREVDKVGWDPAYNGFKNLMASRKVEEKAVNLDRYGLTKPMLVVRFGDEKTPYKLEVGEKNPIGDAYFVHAIKDDGIYTVSSYKIDQWKALVAAPPLVPLPTPSPKPTPTAVPATPSPAASTPASKASPAASPMASPLASPKASPLASPVASPMASTKPSAAPAASPSPIPSHK